MSDSWRNELITKGAAFDVLTEVESHYEFEDGHDHLMRWAKTKIFALPSEQPVEDVRSMCGECDAWNIYNNYSQKYSQPQDIARDIATIIENEKDMRVMLQQRWIPVTERLPEEDTEVIVSCIDDSGDSEFSYTTTGWYYKGIWVVDNERSFFVRAWMSLPEPWKGE